MADGSRLRKDHPRCEAMGDVDELNAHLGLLAAHLAASPLPAANAGDQHEPDPQDTEALRRVRDQLRRIQDELFDLGGGLSMPGHSLLPDEAIGRLEAEVEQANERLAPLREFVIPGGSVLMGQCHVARTVARRAERRVATLMWSAEPEAQPSLLAPMQYLNRLSDWLFVMGRLLAELYGTPQPQWRGTGGDH